LGARMSQGEAEWGWANALLFLAFASLSLPKFHHQRVRVEHVVEFLNFAAAATALAFGVAWVERREWAWAFYTFISVIAPLSSVTLEVHTRYMAAVFPLFVMLAVRGRSPLIDQTIHTVFLAPLTLMTAFFGFFSPAVNRKDDQLEPEPEK